MSEAPDQPRVGALISYERTGPMQEDLRQYRLVPAVGPEDPNWDNAPCHGVVTVWAASPADARIVAAEAEVDFLDIGAKPGDGTTTRPASAFRNEKLYHVEEMGDSQSGWHSRGVISQE